MEVESHHVCVHVQVAELVMTNKRSNTWAPIAHLHSDSYSFFEWKLIAVQATST